MATEKQSTLSSRGNILTTELNALADGSFSPLSPEYDNTSNKDRFGVIEVGVDFGSAPTDFSVFDLYMIPALNGTDYTDGSDSVRPGAENYVCSVELLATTSAQRLRSKPFELLSSKVKFVLKNSSGQAFPASGSTVSLYTFNREIG